MRISEYIHQGEAGGATLRLLHHTVESVVTVVGSFNTRPDLECREDLVQEVAVELLDKGTVERDRFEIAREIEDRGADVGFGSNDLSVHFAIRVLKHDLDDVMHLVAEQLRFPAFEEEEFDKAKHQLGSRIRHSIDNTGARAGMALRAALFAPGHPNHEYSPADDLEALAKITLADIQRYHEDRFSPERLVLCAAGDLDVSTFERAADSSFSGFGPRNDTEPVSFRQHVREPELARIDIPIDDRMNLDIRIGSAVDLKRDNPDFVPVHVAIYILGGNFSARLMSYVREELGLTYGISSRLIGFDREYGGFWQIGVTLSQENLEAGLEATMETVRRFVSEGITAEELIAKKSTLNGLYKVGLSTTRGLAQAMHGHFRNGFDISYIDDYPELVAGLTVDQVNEAIRTYLDAEWFVTAVAGTIR